MAVCDVQEQTPPATQPIPLNLPEGVPPLRCFYIYLSDNCNMRCRHCWIEPRFTDGKPDPGRVVDLEALRAAVREAKTIGLASSKLTGGEPLLHPQFLEVADMLTAEGLSLFMETNATLLTPEIARHLKEKTSLSHVAVSIDGADAETHDAFRGVPGSFDATLRGLQYLKEAGFQETQVIMSVHRGNRSQVEGVVNLAAKHGADSVKLNPVNPSGRGGTMHERGETLDYDEVMELARFLDSDLCPRAPTGIYMGMPPALSSLRRLQTSGGSCGDCGVRGILGILGTNHFALCGIGTTCPEFLYGVLGQDSVRDIWLNNPTVLYLRQALADLDGFPGICAQCIFARVCRTGCVADNHVQAGKLIATEWMCAEAVRRGTFPSARALRRQGQLSSRTPVGQTATS